ncbi:hypothetical protein RZS08_04815, partial [Arthrospira platensis SPKY1]|nr:hypothetical protein [Arthrospira platensis SPKY1]
PVDVRQAEVEIAQRRRGGDGADVEPGGDRIGLSLQRLRAAQDRGLPAVEPVRRALRLDAAALHDAGDGSIDHAIGQGLAAQAAPAVHARGRDQGRFGQAVE